MTAFLLLQAKQDSSYKLPPQDTSLIGSVLNRHKGVYH